MEPKERAESLLQEIRRLLLDLKGVQESWNVELQKLEAKYQPKAHAIKTEIEGREKTLIKLGMAHKAEIFDGADIARLKNGTLIYSRFSWVKRAKGVIPKLKTIGRDDLLKIVESADWDKIIKEPDEVLAQIGSGREMREKVEYEIKG